FERPHPRTARDHARVALVGRTRPSLPKPAHGTARAFAEPPAIAGIGTTVPGRWAAGATRAKISSRRPNAIIRPSYMTDAMFSADSALARCETTTTMQPSLRKRSI